jgi:hypothetical protein
MVRNTKVFGKCGFLAILLMLIIGTIFGVIGVVLAHALAKFYSEYYLILIFPIFIALVLGTGLSFGARIGRCSRFSVVVFLLILFFSVLCYGSYLFLNYYYDSLAEKPVTVIDEGFLLAEDIQQFLAALPYVSDYIPPVENPARPHIGTQISEFITKLPDLAFAREPVVVGTIFDLVPFVPIREYLVYPGITRWDEEHGQLVFDEQAVQPWMLWSAELFFLWLITLLKTLGGIKRAHKKLLQRLEKRGERRPSKEQRKAKPKAKKGRFKKAQQQTSPSTTLDLTPPQLLEEEAAVAQEPPVKKKKRGLFQRKKPSETEGQEDVSEEIKEKPKKKGWFGRKSPEPEVQTEVEAVASETVPPELKFSTEEQTEQLYALILHQYSSDRQEALVRLVQQVGQISEERAQRLLKVPSLIKRNVTTREASIVIEKFNQVQAQVKLITMEQLEELQKKQQQTVQPPRSQPAPPPPVTPEDNTGERHALILRKFDPAQRKPVIELLASLSNTPVAQLQQTLKTPALVLRDASKDEVTMIAQQFRTIQADVKILTMAELQKLMARK